MGQVGHQGTAGHQARLGAAEPLAHQAIRGVLGQVVRQAQAALQVRPGVRGLVIVLHQQQR